MELVLKDPTSKELHKVLGIGEHRLEELSLLAKISYFKQVAKDGGTHSRMQAYALLAEQACDLGEFIIMQERWNQVHDMACGESQLNIGLILDAEKMAAAMLKELDKELTKLRNT